MVDALIKITFLLEREYYPYSKWIGTAFKQLSSYKWLIPHFRGVMHATTRLCTLGISNDSRRIYEQEGQ